MGEVALTATMQREYKMLNEMAARLHNKLSLPCEAVKKTQLVIQSQAIETAMMIQALIAGEEGIDLRYD